MIVNYLRIVDDYCRKDINFDGQATKGTRWMPWRWEAMKDAADGETPRVIVKQVLIRGFPNGATQRGLCRVISLLNI